MTEARRALERQRDHALGDLIDLDRQVAEGQISEEDARSLRAGYEVEAVSALAALDAGSRRTGNSADQEPSADGRAGLRSRSTSRRFVYIAGLALAVLAGVLVPRFVVDRPPGGYVTGNEALQQPGQTTPPAPPAASQDLDEVSNQELEAVVDANPEVVGMRLALARRYATAGRLDLAVVHYTRVLDQEPRNGRAQAGLAWVLLNIGRVEEAQRLVDEALANDPELLEGLWVQANLRLYGLGDPEGALDTLDEMLALGGLPPEVRGQVDRMRSEALAREEPGR